MWMNSDDYSNIPNEKRALCVAAHLSPRRYSKVWLGEIMPDWNPMFRVEGNRLVCNGLRKEAEKQEGYHKRASSGGKATLNERQKSAKRALNVCTPSPSPSPTQVTDNGSPPESIEEPAYQRPANSPAAAATALGMAQAIASL